jgi:hypothetical protein
VKRILKSFTFAFISLSLVQQTLGGLDFGDNFLKNLLLIGLALSLVNLLLPLILGLVGFLSSGIGYVAMHILITGIVLFVLTIFVPGYSIQESVLPEIQLFGILLPAQIISPMLSIGFSALIFSLFTNYLFWLTERKK